MRWNRGVLFEDSVSHQSVHFEPDGQMKQGGSVWGHEHHFWATFSYIFHIKVITRGMKQSRVLSAKG